MLKTQSMNLDVIRTFVVVGQSKSFQEASVKLLIDRSSVSRHIALLEETLGFKVIKRLDNNLIELTKMGKKLFDSYEKIYNKLLLVEKNLVQNSTSDGGKISIGVSCSLDNSMFLDKIKLLKRKYPKLIFKIVTNTPNNLYKNLSQYYLDFIITEQMVLPNNYEYIEKKLFSQKFCIVFSNDFYDLKNESELNNVPLILPTSALSERTEIENWLIKNNINKNLSLEIDDYNSSLYFVKEGIGVAIIPKNIVENSKENLKTIDIDIIKEYVIAYIKDNLSKLSSDILELIVSE